MDNDGSVPRLEAGLSSSIDATERSRGRHDERLLGPEHLGSNQPRLESRQEQSVLRAATW